jgi:PIN domain nuclease of toxin-antitoxin system
VASLLLDTCSLLWLAAEPSRLSPAAAAALGDEANALSVSDVSALEIALEWSAGKLGLPSPPRTWFESQVTTWGLSTVPLRRVDIYRATELPEHHRDPFDRLLVAQALDGGLTIVTPDAAVAAYPVATLW